MNYFGNNYNKYFHLKGEIGDVLRAQSEVDQISDPYIITNILPTMLHMYTQKNSSEPVNFLSEIKPRETKKFHPMQFTDGEKLYVFYHGANNSKIPFLESYTFRPWWKNIKLGAVTYTSTSGHGEVQASWWDMRGVWIHNKLPIPLDIYYKGRLAAQVFGYNGTDYMGGGASSIYFDNDREGLNFMDEIEFRYSLSGKETNKSSYGKNNYLFKVIIDDYQCNEMFVGVISAGEWGPDPDNGIYRVDKPDYTGITYYVSTGGYQTRATNPMAPF